jgi:tetratricopeptide (TPR) repeat protein
MKLSLQLISLILAVAAPAQVFDPTASGGATAPATSGGTPSATSGGQPKQFLGQDVPFMDPGSETAQWDGHVWNITNNRIFRARFEKYLATPEDRTGKDAEYRELLAGANKFLSPANPGGPDIASAMRNLVKAADYPIDARLCDSIAQAVYGVVLHRKNERLLARINKELEKERHNAAWNFEVQADAEKTREKMSQPTATSGRGGQQAPQQQQNTKTVSQTAGEFSRAGSYIKKIVEIDATRVANAAKMTASELKSKIEFQALIIQLFLQRRFEHVIISSRLYRNLYEDGDSQLNLKEGSDVDKMFSKSLGTTPTVGALDAMSSEFIRDVDEGVDSFVYLADKHDLESASKRLMEAFTIGEYLPKMRTLPRTQKEKVLTFVRDTNQLLSAIEMKDYTLAEEIVERLRKDAKDFDYSKPRAAIETARAASGLHIQNARSAAIAKDNKKAAEEVEKAALIWPTNPDLKAFSAQVATYGDMQSRILNDLDTLIAQNNLREIWREQVKYSGAVLGRPEYETKLKAVLEKVRDVEKVVITADEMERGGDRYGAWDRLKEIAETAKDDNEVNVRLARLSEHCAEYIRVLKDAKEHEDKGRNGVGLALYLKAERIYPHSLLAKAGIERLADKILPEDAPDKSTAPAEPPVPVFIPGETDVPPASQPGSTSAPR